MGISREKREELVEWDLHEQTDVTPLEFTEELKPELYGLQVSEANGLVGGIDVIKHELQVLKDAYIDVIQLEITAENLPVFKDLRKNFTKNRTSAEKLRKAKKSYFLNGGRFVDAIFKSIDAEREMMESKLLEAEKYFENLEKEKARLLNLERIEKVRPFVEDADNMNFADFSDYDFEDFVLGKKTRFENEQKAKIEAEQKAEAERIAEIERQKAIEIENAKLKAEAEAKEKELQKEREEAKRLQDIKDDELAKERAEAKAKQEAIELKAKQEREKAEKEVLEERERTFKKVRELRSEACDFLIEKGFEKTSDHGGMYWFNIGGCKKSVLNYKESNLYFEKHDALDTFKKLVSAEVNLCLSEAEAEAKADAEIARISAEKKASAELAKAPIKKQLSVWVESFNHGLQPVENETTKEILAKFESFKKWAKTEINKI